MVQEKSSFQVLGSQPFEDPSIATMREQSELAIQMLKIERFRARVRLSVELRSEDLDQVKTELQKCGASAVLDLEEVNLSDVEGVRFLNECEAKGISVVHCSPYIRQRMSRECSPAREPASGEHFREDDN